MSRLLLIVVLSMQLLVAQAAVAGMSCMHALSEPSAEHSAAMPHHNSASQDDQQSVCDCGCDMAGHCSGSTIVAVQSAAVIDYSVNSGIPAKLIVPLACGYRTPPYRPPPTTA